MADRTRVPMRFAYADPPYLGQGAKHYGDHHDEAADWDHPARHRQLVERLTDDYPDGWALSLSVPSLGMYLGWCPDDVRVAAWVKPFHVFKKGVRPAYAWEPVIFRGGRNDNPEPPSKGEPATTPRDWLAANITLRKGLPGAKPDEFCYWVFDLLNVQSGDQLDDLFPGTGIVGRCFEAYVNRDQPVQTGLFSEVAS